jgi:hypothetical protein
LVYDIWFYTMLLALIRDKISFTVNHDVSSFPTHINFMRQPGIPPSSGGHPPIII